MALRHFTLILAGLASAFAQVPSNDEIRKILVDRVGAEDGGLALVVGVIDANGRRVVSYGSLDKRDPRRLDGDTVFEIGSMTKVFTSLLMTDMARRGEVALTDPVSKYLPPSVKVPERNGRKITLADLSTHSSGLPRMPSNFAPKDTANPYIDYTVQQLYDFLSGHKLERDIGSEYEYSNLGAGLLGHALSLRARMSYEALVRSRITDPLGMSDTRMTFTPEMRARLAVGHNANLDPVANWDIPTLAGAGAFRSTVNDMLTFLAANLGFIQTPLAQAMADAVSIRRPGENPETKMAYGWEVSTKGENSIIWKGGATGGYRTYMGYDPKARVGVVVLSNTLRAVMDEIGPHLLNSSYPLSEMRPAAYREVAVDPEIFERYVGTYDFDAKESVTISQDSGRFYAQLTGQRKLEIFAETARKFFYKAVDAQLTFDADQVTLHQNGREHIAKRRK